jgi:carboxymethylenebutenolidase
MSSFEPRLRKTELAGVDGHCLTVWRAEPDGAIKGGIIVLHAVYGLTDHMGDVCARWARAGYLAIAPALFARRDGADVLPYSTDGVVAGSRFFASLTREEIFRDIETCVAAAGSPGRVAISGFCTGGTWAWKAAAAMTFAAQVNFYGSHVFHPENIDLTPLCPTIMHYGDSDHVVSPIEIERIRTRHPSVDMHVHPGAGHAFMNPEQSGFDAIASERAWASSIAFMDRRFATLASS